MLCKKVLSKGIFSKEIDAVNGEQALDYFDNILSLIMQEKPL
jgi:hypothetical protein